MCYDVLRTFTDAKPYAKCCEIFHTWSIWLTEIPNIYIYVCICIYIYMSYGDVLGKITFWWLKWSFG